MEENLMYVGLTRAKKWLMMNATLMAIVERHKRKLEESKPVETNSELVYAGDGVFTRPQGEQAGYLFDQMMDDYNGPDQIKGGM